MSELISRQEVEEVIKRFYERMGVDLKVGIWNGQLAERLKEADEEDVRLYLVAMWRELRGLPGEDLVRCKDCKRYESDGGALMTCTLHDLIVDDECFCWWGERREE